MADTEKETVVKSIVRYSSSSVYQHILGVFTAFIKPKLLSPELYGLWNILNVIPTYASYSNLGSYDIMRYKIPYHEAKKEHNRSTEIQDSVFYGTFYINLLICITLIILAFFGNLSHTLRLGLLLIAVIVITQWYHDNYVLILKAYQNFKLLSFSIYMKATFALFFSALLIYTLSIYGALLTPIVTVIPVILYLKTKYPVKRFTGFKFHVFSELVRQGFPIMIYNFGAILIATSDRIVISYFLGNKQLGYYGIAIMIFSFIKQIPGTAREVIEPKLMQDITENEKENTLREYLFKPLINTAYFMPFLVGPVIFFIPVLIPLLLPKYVPGIPATQIIIFGCYFLALSYVTRGIIIANNWQLKAAMMMVFVLFINVTLSIILLKLGTGINGVALSSSISQFILLLSSLGFIRINCNYAIKEWYTNIIGLCRAFIVMCVTILILHYVFSFIPMNAYISALIKLAIFYGLMVFSIIRAQKKYLLLKGFPFKEI